MSYYDNLIFTPQQATHAQRVVLDLIKNRRFFLQINAERGHSEYDFGLHPDVFREAIELDTRARNLYTSTRERAVEQIKQGETELGITPPNLENNRQLVVCNRYGGGFDICRVYPLTHFESVAATTMKELVNEHLDLFIGERSHDEITPKEMRDIEERALSVAKRIRLEFNQLGLPDTNNRRCVVMLRSKFDCSGSDRNNDFAFGRVADLQETPFALGYLFWKMSSHSRVFENDHVVFGTSRKSHVDVYHWPDIGHLRGPLAVDYDKCYGYDCSVVFVTAL